MNDKIYKVVKTGNRKVRIVNLPPYNRQYEIMIGGQMITYETIDRDHCKYIGNNPLTQKQGVTG